MSYISTTHSCYFNKKNKDWLDVCYRVYFKIIAEQKVPERGKSDVDVQTKGESKKIVHQEKDGEKKRKRAHEDDVRNKFLQQLK